MTRDNALRLPFDLLNTVYFAATTTGLNANQTENTSNARNCGHTRTEQMSRHK